ncbi:MAG: RagB/SusD family nutrient uptake outer membrane protein [Bacteroidales bacterium]
MRKINFIYIVLIAAILVSCNDFLSERPSKSSDIVPSTVEDMESILAGMWREDCISPNLVYGGGDIDLNAELEKRISGAYSVEVVQGATWEREFSGTNKDYMWMYRYQNIFRSNLVFFYIDKITATPSQVAMIKSEASFRRALSYMELLTVYTLPYCNDNLNELGLPLTTTTGFDYSLERASIKDTYDFIEKDIIEALKITVELKNKFGQGSVYRVTSAAANALAARFYLMKHNYVNAKKYAEAALAKYGVENIMDYNQIGYSSRVDKGTITIDGKVIDFEVKYPNTQFGYDYTNNWTEDYFLGCASSTFSYGFSTDMIPSQAHINCFSEDGNRDMDARWKYFYVKNYGYLNNKPIDIHYYMVNANRNYTITVPEMLLTIAECEARVGDYNKAIALVNQLRLKRIDSAGKINLTATSKEEAIGIVIRERRREMGPIKRLFDVRRYNSNEYAGDDVTIEQNFYNYTPAGITVSGEIKKYELKPGDRRYAAMIPECDILAGKGQLKQNTY